MRHTVIRTPHSNDEATCLFDPPENTSVAKHYTAIAWNEEIARRAYQGDHWHVSMTVMLPLCLHSRQYWHHYKHIVLSTVSQWYRRLSIDQQLLVKA